MRIASKDLPVFRRAAVLVICAAALTLAACATSSARKPARDAAPPESGATSSLAESATNAARPPMIVGGTGRFFEVPAVAASSAGDASAGGFELQFVDTEIGSVVGTVLGEGLGVPFVIDPQVKGPMTLQSAKPLSREQVLPALEAALALQGVALVDVQGVMNVVPMKDAPRRGASLRLPGAGPGVGFAVQVVPLSFVGAEEMQKILQPFTTEGGILRVDEARNLLLLAGSSQDIAKLQEVVKTFDVDWLAGMSFGIFPLEYVDAKTLSAELETILVSDKSPLAGVVRFIPLGRLNSLLVVTPQTKYLKDVEAWIKRLDLGATTPGRRIYVYDVQNAKADDLARSLSRILSLDFDDTAITRPSGAAPRFNLAGTATERGGAVADSTPLPRSSAGASDGEATKIVPNAENNSLMIFATPSEFAVIESALKRLDVMPIQVLIEASLAEVTLTDDMRYGLQWAYQAGDGTAVLSEASSGAISPQFPGFSYLFTGRTDIRAVLNAIESITTVKVLSSPKLLVLNNREAQLQIGDQVPIITQSAVGTVDPDAPIVNAVQFRDTGVILRVTPRVNKSGLVLLDIEQEVSDVVPTTTSGIDSPTIQQRKIQSTVAVKNGETIALGGLIRESRSRSRSGLPLLSRLPILGEFFGSTDRAARRTELIVLITPKVLHSSADVADMMEDIRLQFRGLRKVVPGWRAKRVPAAAPDEPEIAPKPEEATVASDPAP